MQNFQQAKQRCCFSATTFQTKFFLAVAVWRLAFGGYAIVSAMDSVVQCHTASQSAPNELNCASRLDMLRLRLDKRLLFRTVSAASRKGLPLEATGLVSVSC